MGVETCRFGRFTLDPADERLIAPEGPVRIGNKAFRVLTTLIEQPGRLVTKETLFSTVWDGTIVSESALTTVIKELRRALGDNERPPKFIEMVYGRGYRFVAPVEHGAGEVSPAPLPSPVMTPAPAEAVGVPVVLVSRFDDEAVRTEHPYLGSALREEVLSGLARFREIRLVAEAGADTMGRALASSSGRDYRLTATLLPGPDGVKVIARATNLADGHIVWADTMALGSTGIAGGVDTIVRRIIGAALPALDENVFLGVPPGTDEFYGRYLIAKRRSFGARSYDEARGAADDLERLIAERPDFGLAYPPLVRLYNVDFGWTSLGSSGPQERARALELARAGLAADRGNVHAYTVLGFCYLWHDEHGQARDCFDRAQALNPFNPTRLNEVATGLVWLGDFERARSLFDFSMALQPYADDLYYEDRCQMALLEGDHEEVLRMVRKMSSVRWWSSLYEALCEATPDARRRKLKAWIGRVERSWHRGERPSPGELEEWLGFHHKFAEPLRGQFMALLRERLAELDE